MLHGIALLFSEKKESNERIMIQSLYLYRTREKIMVREAAIFFSSFFVIPLRGFYAFGVKMGIPAARLAM